MEDTPDIDHVVYTSSDPVEAVFISPCTITWAVEATLHCKG